MIDERDDLGERLGQTCFILDQLGIRKRPSQLAPRPGLGVAQQDRRDASAATATRASPRPGLAEVETQRLAKAV